MILSWFESGAVLERSRLGCGLLVRAETYSIALIAAESCELGEASSPVRTLVGMAFRHCCAWSEIIDPSSLSGMAGGLVGMGLSDTVARGSCKTLASERSPDRSQCGVGLTAPGASKDAKSWSVAMP